MIAHFLALGDLISAQIAAKMPAAFRAVVDAADLAGVKDSLQLAPACHIVFLGAKPGVKLPRANLVAWDQRWLTVVVTRSAQGAKAGTGARALAGELLSQLLSPGVLSGWTPDVGVQPLEPIDPPAPPLLTQAGTLYVPVAWRARVTAWG
ncbi:MAG: hypothetical protein KGL35_14865 [Bradyrhizobium sp.]|nr:hypothetical protein [Bradyrhizobium sp.]